MGLNSVTKERISNSPIDLLSIYPFCFSCVRVYFFISLLGNRIYALLSVSLINTLSIPSSYSPSFSAFPSLSFSLSPYPSLSILFRPFSLHLSPSFSLFLPLYLSQHIPVSFTVARTNPMQ